MEGRENDDLILKKKVCRRPAGFDIWRLGILGRGEKGVWG